MKLVISDTLTTRVLLSLGLFVVIYIFLTGNDGIDHNSIAQLWPDTEVFYEHPAWGIDLYLVLVNHPEAEIILLYNAREYTDSNPLILRYSEFDRGWIRGYPPEDPR